MKEDLFCKQVHKISCSSGEKDILPCLSVIATGILITSLKQESVLCPVISNISFIFSAMEGNRIIEKNNI